MLSLGHLSPDVITPRGLKKLFIEVESHLPEFLKLPYDPKGKIWKLYQTLTCSTVLDEGRFLVIVSIPLLDKINNVAIYDVFNMAVPHDKTPICMQVGYCPCRLEIMSLTNNPRISPLQPISALAAHV